MKILAEILVSNGEKYRGYKVAHVFEKKRGHFFWGYGESADNFYKMGHKSSSELAALHSAVRYAIDYAKRFGGFKFVKVMYSTGGATLWTCVDELLDRWDVVKREGVV